MWGQPPSAVRRAQPGFSWKAPAHFEAPSLQRKGVPFGTPFSPLSFTSFYVNL